MPRDPEEKAPRTVEIDDEKRWRLKLREVVEMESKFQDGYRKNAVYLSWHFSVHDLENGAAVIDTYGNVFEMFVATSDATNYDPKDPEKIGGAREMANVLMGRDTSIAEIRAWNADGGIEGWNNALVGKTLIADLEWGTSKNGYDRLNLLRKRPDRQAQAPVAEPPPSPPPATAPNGTGETPAERRARLVRELESMDA